MIARYNRWSFVLGVPGLALLFAAGGTADAEDNLTLLGKCFSLFGFALLLIGLAFYAKAKGRCPAWCLLPWLCGMGWFALTLVRGKFEPTDLRLGPFLFVIGWIVLALLKDRSKPTSEVEEKHEQT
jgi:hypothetical protein